MAKLHLVTVSKASFWTVVVSVDLFMEAAFSLDESFLAGSRLHNAYAAMYAMLLSTVAMRAINGPFQRLIEFRPIIGKAIYVSILFIGIEFLFSSQKIDIYANLQWLKPFSSLLIMAIVVGVAEVVTIAKLVFARLRGDVDN